MQIFDKAKFHRQFTNFIQNIKPKDCYLHQFGAQIITDKLDIISNDFRSCLIYGADHHIKHSKLANYINKLPSDYDEEQSQYSGPEFDLIISQFTMQYNNDVVGALVQYRNILKAGGLFICNLFGGTTLYQLKEAMIAADMECFGKVYNRVIPMIEIKQMGALLQRAKFEIPVCVAEEVQVSYPDIYTMLKELKAMGFGNYLLDRTWQYQRHYFDVVARHYLEKFPSEDGRIIATFEVLTATGSCNTISKEY